MLQHSSFGSICILMCHCECKTHKKVWSKQVQADSGTNNQRMVTKEDGLRKDLC